MAKKKRSTKSVRRGKKSARRGKKHGHKKKRKSSYIRAGKKGHIKRGCGKRNWRRGGNAYWKCARGKKHPYRRKKKR